MLSFAVPRRALLRRGRLLAMLAGEGHGRDIDDFVAAALQVYGEKGLLDNTPVLQVGGVGGVLLLGGVVGGVGC